MKLGELLKDLPHFTCIDLKLSEEITQITSSSALVIPGALFVCLDGLHARGADYITEARAAGAVAVERTPCMGTAEGVPSILVPNTRVALAALCSAFWGHPERALQITAVTGTNGKTSTAHYLEEIYRHFGYQTAMIGTICDKVGTTTLPPSGMTTPDPELFYRRLAFFRAQGVSHLFMEASSHALALEKLSGLSFANGIFTNLTPDHLDFHKTVDAYLAAKAKLFPTCHRSFFNIDDPAGKALFVQFAPHLDCISYSLLDSTSHFQAINRETYGIAGISYRMRVGSIDVAELKALSPGSFTFYNTLAAAACAYADEIPISCIREAIAAQSGVPGRMENITPSGAPFHVLIDYAHTPDALQKTLESVRVFAMPGQKISVLFGCGGDRDPTKRATMGEIATALADFAYITEDNSRTENTEDIISMVCKNITHRENFVVINDRSTAIKTAIMEAGADDILVLCGKGHEDYIIRGTEKIPFSEREIVRAATAERNGENRC